WMSAAPAASQVRAVATSSSRVVGSCGTSAFACSAPVGATVMRVADDAVAMAVSVSGPDGAVDTSPTSSPDEFSLRLASAARRGERKPLQAGKVGSGGDDDGLRTGHGSRDQVDVHGSVAL